MTTIDRLRMSLSTGLPTSVWFGTACVLIAAILFGGGTENQFLGDGLVQLMAIPLLVGAVGAGMRGRGHTRLAVSSGLDQPFAWRQRGAGTAAALCALFVLLPALQLVPLPPAVWTSLPGREALVATFQALATVGQGVPPENLPWWPVSVSPRGTWLTLLSMLPALAVFLGTLRIGYLGRRWLSLLVMGLAGASAFLGLLQIAQGRGSSLRFFAYTSVDDAVGFFANRNHLAALLYAALPLTAAWLLLGANALSEGANALGGKSGKSSRGNGGSTRSSVVGASQFAAGGGIEIARVLASLTLLVLLVGGQLLTRSRAGLILTVLALLGLLLLTFAVPRQSSGAQKTGPSGRQGRRLLALAVCGGVVVSIQFTLVRLLDRFAADPLAESRWPLIRNTIAAAKAHMPLGSGLGTFVPVYASYEAAADTQPFYINRAHNDVLELWLETGVIGPLLLAMAAVWFVWRAVTVWRRAGGSWGARGLPHAEAADVLLARAATITLVLLAAHSLIDYPLRTTALMCLFALCCGLLVAPPVQAVAAERGLLAKAPVAKSSGATKPVRKGRTARMPPAPVHVPGRAQPQTAPPPTGVDPQTAHARAVGPQWAAGPEPTVPTDGVGSGSAPSSWPTAWDAEADRRGPRRRDKD